MSLLVEKAMVINGCRLPDSFLHAIETGLLRRETGSWQLQSGRDAYGQPLETELAAIYDTPAAIERETARLREDFEPEEGGYGESLPEMAGPGAIPDIVDFRDIVCFGESGDGAPFCFDYREGGGEPRVIWWNDIYWRLVAPDFESFMSLFDLPDAARSPRSDPARE